MRGVTAAVTRQRRGLPRWVHHRLDDLVNDGELDPCRALCVAVVLRGLHIDGPAWLDAPEGALWCELAELDADVIRMAG